MSRASKKGSISLKKKEESALSNTFGNGLQRDRTGTLDRADDQEEITKDDKIEIDDSRTDNLGKTQSQWAKNSNINVLNQETKVEFEQSMQDVNRQTGFADAVKLQNQELELLVDDNEQSARQKKEVKVESEDKKDDKSDLKKNDAEDRKV